MSFNEFLTEKSEISNLLKNVQKVQDQYVITFTFLEQLKKFVNDEQPGKYFGNLNLNNQIDKIELKMIDLGKLLDSLLSSITGGGTVAQTRGEWNGPI